MSWFKLPSTATAPFCPSEVQGSVVVDDAKSFWWKLARFLGPGLLISVGYMDPGNWATDIAAGSRFGYDLICVVVFSSLAAILIQYLSLKLGIATGKDLAQHIRATSSRSQNIMSWLLAEIAIIACDLAEVLGCAVALKLLFGLNLVVGIIITALDSVIVLGLKGNGFRRIEVIMLGLISTIGLCFLAQLLMVQPQISEILQGLIPRGDVLFSQDGMLLSIGILGATVMPHNLYLHSSIVQTRKVGRGEGDKRVAIKLAAIDSSASLGLALLINAAILVLAAKTFHESGHLDVADIEQAHSMLTPLVGSSLAGILFGVGLLASGQSSTLTGTIAGQVVMEGHINFKMPCWKRRVITRALALIPALLGVLMWGEGSVGKILIFSQVVLSLQLPFALFPLISFASDRRLMGGLEIQRGTRFVAWGLFAIITAANMYLVGQTLWDALKV